MSQVATDVVDGAIGVKPGPDGSPIARFTTDQQCRQHAHGAPMRPRSTWRCSEAENWFVPDTEVPAGQVPSRWERWRFCAANMTTGSGGAIARRVRERSATLAASLARKVREGPNLRLLGV